MPQISLIRWLSFASVLGIAGMLRASITMAEPVNAGKIVSEPARPFAVAAIASFDTPWAIAFLPDARMLITEKPGHLFLVTQAGRKTEVGGVPVVAYSGQNGLLDVAISPHFAADGIVYLSYVEPGPGGGGLALARARLELGDSAADLRELTVIWRQLPKGRGGQPGGIITFDPQGTHLYLTSGDRQRFTPAQDPDQALGKILRLNLDGTTPADNPMAPQGGVRAQTWTTGHRNPYGLAFAPDGRLWEHEMGPMGGDEFNLILPGSNYGWPAVSYGDNYDGTPIPKPETHPEFALPALYWNPTIAPAGLAFYTGDLFPHWKGSALIGGLAGETLVRVMPGPGNTATQLDRWDMGARIRDVAVAPDGAVWLIEDAEDGRLLRLTPGKS